MLDESPVSCTSHLKSFLLSVEELAAGDLNTFLQSMATCAPNGARGSCNLYKRFRDAAHLGPAPDAGAAICAAVLQASPMSIDPGTPDCDMLTKYHQASLDGIRMARQANSEMLQREWPEDPGLLRQTGWPLLEVLCKHRHEGEI